MYSKKNQIRVKTKKQSNDFIDNKNKLFNSYSTRNITDNNNINIFETEEDKNIDNSLNNDYFKEYYCSKKKKNNIVSYYSKKRFKSIIFNNNNKPLVSNYIIHSEPFYSDINSLDKIKKIATYKIKNPEKEKSKNKNRKQKESQNNTSKNTLTLNKEEKEEEELINLYSNNNTIYTDFLNNTENIKNTNSNINSNLNSNINRSFRRNIELSRYQDNNFSSKKGTKFPKIDFLLQNTSNASKGVSFIMDFSKDDEKDNFYYEFPISRNKYVLNRSFIRKPKSLVCSSLYDDSFRLNKRKKNKTPNRSNEFIRKQIEFRKKKFEKMREIEKKIKEYFLVNGISLKNRELYHQSAIMIQSTFRAHLSRLKLYKELNIFVGIKLIFDFLNKIFSERNNIYYYKIFFDNIKKYTKKIKTNIVFLRNEDYEYHIKNKNIMKKSNIIKKHFIKEKKDLYFIESTSNFKIIGKNNVSEIKYIKINRNQNLILLNKKLTNEKKNLEEEIQKLKLENEKLQKDIEIYKAKEKENILSESSTIPNIKIVQTDIHKNDENIENVSLELKEMKIKKKKIDELGVPILNLKKNINININDRLWKEKIPKNEKYYLNKHKKLYLKYLIIKKDINIKEYKRKIFLQYLNNIKKVLNDEQIKDKNNKEKYIKINTSKSKIQKAKIYNNNNNLIQLKMEEKNNKDYKNQKLKKLINEKIKQDKNILNKIFIKFYYQGLLINNNIKNNNITNQKENISSFINKENEIKAKKIKIVQKLVMNNIKKDKCQLKFLFYKFFYNGIISTLKSNIPINQNKKKIDNKIYVKRVYENRKISNKNNE